MSGRPGYRAVLSSVKSGNFCSLALFAHGHLFAIGQAQVRVKQRVISLWIAESSYGTDISVVGGENPAPSSQAEQLICIGSSQSCPRFRSFPWFEWLGSRQGWGSKLRRFLIASRLPPARDTAKRVSSWAWIYSVELCNRKRSESTG